MQIYGEDIFGGTEACGLLDSGIDFLACLTRTVMGLLGLKVRVSSLREHELGFVLWSDCRPLVLHLSLAIHPHGTDLTVPHHGSKSTSKHAPFLL